jgi:hypothetical protein
VPDHLLMTELALPEIQSAGPPPVRHSERVMRDVMVVLAQHSAHLESTLKGILGTFATGNPAAQKRMEARFRAAGHILSQRVVSTSLRPGKRGKFRFALTFFSGWDFERDEEIKPGDIIPPRHWIAIWHVRIKSEGNGRESVRWRRGPLCFVSHHVLSRLAQRYDVRTVSDALQMVLTISGAVLKLVVDKGHPAWLNPPPQGWRVDLANGATLVLQKHASHETLVAVTAI